MNVSKAKLEGLFVDELKELQPTAGFMWLVKEHALRAWEQRKAEVCRDVADIERRAKAIQQKLDRLDEAFLFAQSIDITTYERHRDKLRQELTFTQIDEHSVAVENVDVEGILAFAERVLPTASDLWVQASLNQRQRLQQLFFPEGIAFDGKQFVRTGVTANAFRYLTAVDSSQNDLAAVPVDAKNAPQGRLGKLPLTLRHESGGLVKYCNPGVTRRRSQGVRVDALCWREGGAA